MRKPPALVAFVVAAALALAACGGDDPDLQGDASDVPGSVGSGTFNDADVAFAQSMIPHHNQALEMSRLARTHARSREVKRLAASIEAAQGPEIEQMSRWMAEWDPDSVPDAADHDGMDGMAGMDSSGATDHANMPGMMSAEDLRRLSARSGGAWDRMFLTMMVEHHLGAIDMARREQAEGQSPDALALARRIETAQSAEIDMMRELLRR